MSRNLYPIIVLLCLSLSLFFALPVRASVDFNRSPLGQYITNNPEEFAKVETFVAGLGGFIDTSLAETAAQAKANPSVPGYRLMVKALIACKDQVEAFAAATDARTSSAHVIAKYNIAGQLCRSVTNLLMPYFSQDQQTMMVWQKKMTPLMRTPGGVDMMSLVRAYNESLELRSAAQITGQVAEVEDNFSVNEHFPLPEDPYQFNWAEMDQIRAHMSAAMDKYQINDLTKRSNSDKKRFQVCSDFLDGPKDLKLLYMALNDWIDSCSRLMGRFSSNKYSGDLGSFSRRYREAFYKNEEKRQRAGMRNLPSLPSQPYQFHHSEIEAYKEYMVVATSQSLNLSYALQEGGSVLQGFSGKKEVCGGTQTDNLKSDLTNPLIKSNWQGFVGKLLGCAKNIERNNKPAGVPLVRALNDYMASLQTVPSQSLFK